MYVSYSVTSAAECCDMVVTQSGVPSDNTVSLIFRIKSNPRYYTALYDVVSFLPFLGVVCAARLHTTTTIISTLASSSLSYDPLVAPDEMVDKIAVANTITITIIFRVVVFFFPVLPFLQI